MKPISARRTRTLSTVAIITVIVSAFGIVQGQKSRALVCLAEYGGISDWRFFGYPLARAQSIPHWVPGVWPRRLGINSVPSDPARYIAAVQKLPRLDMIMVFVYEPMSLDIFAALGAIPKVRRLDLTSTSVNDSAFRKFTQFATVEELFLGFSIISDVSVPQILQFRKLRELEIDNNALSDLGVSGIGQLPALQKVSLDERLSANTVFALRASRPDLQVSQ